MVLGYVFLCGIPDQFLSEYTCCMSLKIFCLVTKLVSVNFWLLMIFEKVSLSEYHYSISQHPTFTHQFGCSLSHLGRMIFVGYNNILSIQLTSIEQTLHLSKFLVVSIVYY